MNMNILLYLGLSKRIQNKYRLQRKSVSEATIIKAVSEITGISFEQMVTKTRKRPIVEARQIVMYLMYWHVADITLRGIGDMFYRDHTTVIHSLKTVSDLIDTNASYRNKIDKIKSKLHLN